jgi:hypothetical protein
VKPRLIPASYLGFTYQVLPTEESIRRLVDFIVDHVLSFSQEKYGNKGSLDITPPINRTMPWKDLLCCDSAGSLCVLVKHTISKTFVAPSK